MITSREHHIGSSQQYITFQSNTKQTLGELQRYLKTSIPLWTDDTKLMPIKCNRIGPIDDGILHVVWIYLLKSFRNIFLMV